MNSRETHHQFLERIEQNRAILTKICLFYAATTFDQDDLFQEIVLQAWKNYARFRKEAQFSTWLYRVAINTALFACRTRKPNSSELPAETHLSYNEYPDHENYQHLRTAIDTLNEVDRLMVLLYLDGYDYEEMADVIGISGATLRVKMHRVKGKLQKILK